jgi:hypothetical protein
MEMTFATHWFSSDECAAAEPPISSGGRLRYLPGKIAKANTYTVRKIWVCTVPALYFTARWPLGRKIFKCMKFSS